MISSTRTTRVTNINTSIPQYVMIYFHRQRYIFMVIELRFFKKKKKMAKMSKTLFENLHISCITDQPIFVYWLFFTHSSL